MAKAAGWGVMTSHRSGETEDTFIVRTPLNTPCARFNRPTPPRPLLPPNTAAPAPAAQHSCANFFGLFIRTCAPLSYRAHHEREEY
eukprot:4623605-Pleurochrysis_carterae.AAC.1